MKKVLVLILLLVPLLFLFGCETNVTPAPDGGGQSGDTDPSGGQSGDADPSGGQSGDTDPSGGQSGDTDPSGGQSGDTDPSGGQSGDTITYLTVTEAYQMAMQAGDVGTSEKQYVVGVVKNITKPAYGEMYITDGTTDLYVYGVYSSDGALRYSELDAKPYAGDTVYLYGYLKTYNDSPEMGSAWLQKFEVNEVDIDLDSYSEMTISEARTAEVNQNIIIEGVVAKITFANGMNPNGIYVVDETGSIYVYGIDVASRVEEGQKVKVAGTKTLYILADEQNAAQEFGYQGSIQLQDAIFISASSEKYDFDKSWIKESTVKKIIETPMSTNITTDIFKVNAIVHKVPGSGFVNYYIDDLDDHTGSYCYTLCNGSDFSWLDEYDGKVCTVYLSALNCKATKSGTVYRFIPISVKVNNALQLNPTEVALFALEYYVVPQFRYEYNSDPALELIDRCENAYIPFEDVTISYSSSSNNVTFTTEDEKTIMHVGTGNSEIKIVLSATYDGVTEEIEHTIFVNTVEEPDSITVLDAINATDGETVTVKGVVMSGTVNQTGFYLNDGTGVIAVRCTSDTIKQVGLGDQVIITGIKTHAKKETSTGISGQLCIDKATLELNLYGNHQIDTSTFITNLTFDELVELSSSAVDDLTMNVYTVTCYLKKVESTYYTNFYLTDSTKTKDIYLYAGSGSQYSIYNEFLGDKELTVTFMLVNWNDKQVYRGCIIFATDGETTIVNNYNFR